MKGFENIWEQVSIICHGLPRHLRESPISTVFLICIIIVLVLNIIKHCFICLEKRRGTPHLSCEYLFISENGQDCDHLSYRKRFKKNGNSCEGCRGKSFQMTNAEAEKRVVTGAIWKHIIILMANYSKSLLPYISFLYTLAMAIFENYK